MPIGTREDSINAVLLRLPKVCDNLVRRIVIYHGFGCRGRAVRDATIRIATDNEARDAMGCDGDRR